MSTQTSIQQIIKMQFLPVFCQAICMPMQDMSPVEWALHHFRGEIISLRVVFSSIEAHRPLWEGFSSNPHTKESLTGSVTTTTAAEQFNQAQQAFLEQTSANTVHMKEQQPICADVFTSMGNNYDSSMECTIKVHIPCLTLKNLKYILDLFNTIYYMIPNVLINIVVMSSLLF